ncbi:Creatinase/aminopeptidase [Nadsonia fulvescens var. elongata DSM 6958]|uniref:Probable metalloprotease ARX1 n=1 Tax=Nadsonia fulvescens var. elongata DSM 6958 TaxID=857566 RepID=A0A1E3PS64_9ASCO|nr:Creatinase/aminopeptidase [Nadsonia fulvescens var. elongata DSM 6958]
MNMQVDFTPEQRVLVDEKNVLSEVNIEKYRLAGQISQTCLSYIISLLKTSVSSGLSIGEICRLGDSFLQKTVDGVFKRSVEEKGIALPVSIDKNGFVFGVAPEEEDLFQGGQLVAGDIVKITLGVHIDGYTAQVSHTQAIVDDEDAQSVNTPLTGGHADAVCAAYLATEAVIALLGSALYPTILSANNVSNITGHNIRSVVETVAKSFNVQVVPGSRVRRVRRFLAGQNTVVEEKDFKGVTWNQDTEEEKALQTTVKENAVLAQNGDHDWIDAEANPDDFLVEEGEAWLVDIQMAATGGKKGVIRMKEFSGYNDTINIVKPTIFSRDFAVHYGLKLRSSRITLGKIEQYASVYPFKLTHVTDEEIDLPTARLGLSELINHHIIETHPIQIANFIPLSVLANPNGAKREIANATVEVSVARNMTTLILVPASQSTTGYGEVMRLTGGSKVAPPPWVHSSFEITDNSVLGLLNLLQDKKLGVRVKEVQASKVDPSAAADISLDDMVME